MRALGKAEKDKRGCLYCLEFKGSTNRGRCEHDECPYRELDDYETYEDYFKSQSTDLASLLEEIAK